MLLDNTTGLIFGVSSRRSIAWGIAQALAGSGARLAFTYRERVGPTSRRSPLRCPAP